MNKNSWIKAGLLASCTMILIRIIGIIPCLNCLFIPITCLAWLIVPLGTGYLTALWSELDRNQYDKAAIQGALSGLILGVSEGISIIIIFIFQFFFSFTSNSWLNVLENNQELFGFFNNSNQLSGIGTLFLIGGFGIISGFIMIIKDVFFSIIGGIIRTALSKN